jgi:cell division protein FtsQ
MPEFNEPKRRKKPSPAQKPSRTADKPKAKKEPKPPPSSSQARSPVTAKPKKPKPADLNNKQKQRRRKNMVIYYLMFLFAAVIVFSILAATVLFTLEYIEVEGDTIYPDEQIITVSGIRTGVNLLRFDTSEGKRRLIDNLVYVDSVEIRKNLPSRITIHIVGAVEMAVIEHEGLFFKVSKNGRLLEITGRSTSLPVIFGFDADEPVVGGYLFSNEARKTELLYTLMNTIEEVGLHGIADINIRDVGDIRMNYMNRVTLLLGDSRELERKLRAAVYILTEDIDQNERGTLRLIEQQPVFTPE